MIWRIEVRNWDGEWVLVERVRSQEAAVIEAKRLAAAMPVRVIPVEVA